jgi:hypothetical protein
MHIVPKECGKDAITAFILECVGKIVEKQAEVYCLGDGNVDVPMLNIQQNNQKIVFHPYLVSPTYLAEHAVKNAQIINKSIQILHKDGPSVLLSILKNHYREKLVRSQAQNNWMRTALQPLNAVLNNLVDKKLNANEVSFLGMRLIIENQQAVTGQHLSFGQKAGALIKWSRGMVMDVLDGIRARSGSVVDQDGQLVDVFCDRVKEFTQLYFRAQRRLDSDVNAGTATFLAAMSCILPSLARAEAESEGVIVEEYDKQGGSMLSRTFALFKSFVYTLFEKNGSSLEIDKDIYSRNMATFSARRSRKAMIKISSDEKLKQKARKRMYFLLKLFREEHEMVEKYLILKSPEALIQYLAIMKPILNLFAHVKIPADLDDEFNKLDLSIKNVMLQFLKKKNYKVS